MKYLVIRDWHDGSDPFLAMVLDAQGALDNMLAAGKILEGDLIYPVETVIRAVKQAPITLLDPIDVGDFFPPDSKNSK
jgi:hypothetical protein